MKSTEAFGLSTVSSARPSAHIAPAKSAPKAGGTVEMPQPFHSMMFAMHMELSVSGKCKTDRPFENICPFLSKGGAVVWKATQDTAPFHEDEASACGALV